MSTRDAGPAAGEAPAEWTGNPRIDPAHDVERLASSLLEAALWLSLWVAVGSFVLAVTGDMGAHPARRLAVGLLLVTVSVVALWQRKAVGAIMRARPWLVTPLAAGQLAVAVIDGVLPGPYVVVSMTSLGLAVIVAHARTVWLTVALLEIGYVVAVLLERSPSELDGRELAGVLGQLLGVPFAALVLLGLARLFTRFLAEVEPTLDAIRGGAAALTPGLTLAIARASTPALARPDAPVQSARSSSATDLRHLTPREIAVMNALADGLAPKEIAAQWDVSINTLRTHIKNAKRKTGARTPRELAAMVARHDSSGRRHGR